MSGEQMSKQKPKTVQIAVVPYHDGNVFDEIIYALRDDGSIWRIESCASGDSSQWREIAPIPNEE